MSEEAHPRRLKLIDEDAWRPAYVVWELTLRCDLACHHCGSRAGTARQRELSTNEALAVVEQLAAQGTDEVVLIGGEAYLHAGFLAIVGALKQAGIVVSMTTGGRGIDLALARAMAQAGMDRVSVSVDGLRDSHDSLRALKGSYAAAISALAHCKSAGLSITANTNFNRLNQKEAEPLYDALRQASVEAWQVQLTTPLGRAADRTALMLQPWDLLELLPQLERLSHRAASDGIRIIAGNNLGYFGPEEATIRSLSADGCDHWQGCQAGRFVLGIESNGDVKGCPSLQSDSYVGGNLLRQPLASIWQDSEELAFTRQRSSESLWGFCSSCPFAEPCLGGCSFTAHAVFGRAGNNPYCHFRARHFASQGLRERLVPLSAAAGSPFDNGLYKLVVEPFDSPEPPPPERLTQITRRPQGPSRPSVPAGAQE